VLERRALGIPALLQMPALRKVPTAAADQTVADWAKV